MLNHPTVTMTATVVADAEVRFSQGGKAVANVRLVSNPREKDATGQWKDGEPTWLRAVIFGEDGEMAAECLHKGQQVVVTGRLKTTRWEKDGQQREGLELLVDAIGLNLTRFQRVTAEKVQSGQQAPRQQQGQPDPWSQPQQQAGGWGQQGDPSAPPF